MAQRAWLDANAAIALMEGPANALHDQALGVFRRVADGDLEVILTACVMVELAWYFERRLHWSRTRSARRLAQLLASDGVITFDGALERSVDVYARHPRLDYVDAYLSACALAIGPISVLSFDRDLDRVAGLTRIAS